MIYSRCNGGTLYTWPMEDYMYKLLAAFTTDSLSLLSGLLLVRPWLRSVAHGMTVEYRQAEEVTRWLLSTKDTFELSQATAPDEQLHAERGIVIIGKQVRTSLRGA